MSITEFLLARIAEDEETAGGAWRDSLTAHGVPSRWEYGGTAVVIAGTDDAIFQQTPLTDPAGPVVTHVARWDPRRVLAECEAKRRIVALREQAARAAADPPQGAEMLTVTRAAALNEALRILAQPYADHPDYDPAWRLTRD